MLQNDCSKLSAKNFVLIFYQGKHTRLFEAYLRIISCFTYFSIKLFFCFSLLYFLFEFFFIWYSVCASELMQSKRFLLLLLFFLFSIIFSHKLSINCANAVKPCLFPPFHISLFVYSICLQHPQHTPCTHSLKILPGFCSYRSFFIYFSFQDFVFLINYCSFFFTRLCVLLLFSPVLIVT